MVFQEILDRHSRHSQFIKVKQLYILNAGIIQRKSNDLNFF